MQANRFRLHRRGFLIETKTGDRMNDLMDDNDRLKHCPFCVLEGAHAGFGMAYEALEKHRYDEAMLHCGHHHAQTWKALTPNVKVTGAPPTDASKGDDA